MNKKETVYFILGGVVLTTLYALLSQMGFFGMLIFLGIAIYLVSVSYSGGEKR